MSSFDDWRRAPNIAQHPDVYELENEAIARDGRLDRAVQAEMRPAGRRVLDIGCGSGFWLPRYVGARQVIGVEPDPDLRALAEERVAETPSVRVLPGSAEHLPLEAHSVDVAQARFAYFFGPGSERGLAEVERVLAPGGVFVAVDNGWGQDDFTQLLRSSNQGNATIDPDVTASWWAERRARRIEVSAGWRARDPEELERILRIEFSPDIVDAWVAENPGRAALSYTVALYVWRPTA